MYIPQKASASKYKNKKTVIDGIEFDSRREAKRYAELRLMERQGIISNLQRQVRYEVCPKYKGKRTTERAAYYVADFVYTFRQTGELVVEDVKSPITRTPVYILKRKLMAHLYGIEIVEV